MFRLGGRGFVGSFPFFFLFFWRDFNVLYIYIYILRHILYDKDKSVGAETPPVENHCSGGYTLTPPFPATDTSVRDLLLRNCFKIKKIKKTSPDFDCTGTDRPTFCSWLTSEENNKAPCTSFSQSGTVDTTRAAATGPVLPFFGCARAGLCAGRRQKQPRPKVHLRVLRGALPHNSPADMSQFISWKGTRQSVVPVFFYWWNISFSDIFQQWNTSPARRWTPQKGGKIHTLIHLLAPPFQQVRAKNKKKNQNKTRSSGEPARSQCEKALVRFYKAF